MHTADYFENLKIKRRSKTKMHRNSGNYYISFIQFFHQ